MTLPALWNLETAIRDFEQVADLAGVPLSPGAVTIERLPAPHRPPSWLPPGKMAIYVFTYANDTLKVGKAGAKSQARYVSQHYNAGSAPSTLAASIFADRARYGLMDAKETDIGAWIKGHVDRVNLLMDECSGIPILPLLEACLHCRLRPRYEGFKSQRRRGSRADHRCLGSRLVEAGAIAARWAARRREGLGHSVRLDGPRARLPDIDEMLGEITPDNDPADPPPGTPERKPGWARLADGRHNPNGVISRRGRVRAA